MSSQTTYSYIQDGFTVNTKVLLNAATTAIFCHKLTDDGKPNFKPNNKGELQLAFATSSGNSYTYLSKSQANALKPRISDGYIILSIDIKIPPVTMPVDAKPYTIK